MFRLQSPKILHLKRRLTGRRWRTTLADHIEDQLTQEYWKSRARKDARSLRWLSRRVSFRDSLDNLTQFGESIKHAVVGASRGLSVGIVFGLIILGSEWLLSNEFRSVVSLGVDRPAMSGFLILAVEVSASLLGLYLAAVSIVIGTSYHDVASDIRELVLSSRYTRVRLQLVGLAIGAGLFLVLLDSASVPFGYLSFGAFALLLAFAAFAFGQLAFGVFHMFDPLALISEPLSDIARGLRRINRLESAHDSLRRREAQRIRAELRLLTELVRLTRGRASISTTRLHALALAATQALVNYTSEKHRVPYESGWHLPVARYPRWVESDETETSRAIATGVSLQGKEEPDLFWLETTVGQLVSEILEAAILAEDRNTALLVTSTAAAGAGYLAQYRYTDGANAFFLSVSQKCWTVSSDTPAGRAVQAEPPMLLMSALLGLAKGLGSWPSEIQSEVSEAESGTHAVGEIRGPRRVLRTANTLQAQIHAEEIIEGRRITPGWYVRFALADSCLHALREYCSDLPGLVEAHSVLAAPVGMQASDVVALGTRSLQLVEKALLTVRQISSVIPQFEALRAGNDPLEIGEVADATERLEALRRRIILAIAGQLSRLEPNSEKSEPDWFGDAFYRCLEETADAFATGELATARALFPSVFSASLRLDAHVRSHYVGPTYQVNAAVLDPLLDLLELSGLAILYGAIRADATADQVKSIWTTHIARLPDPSGAAAHYLDLLDISRWGLAISQRSLARTRWEMRLARDIVDRGFAPGLLTLSSQEVWDAPRLVKVLGVSASMPTLSVQPRVVLAALVLAPLSRERDEELRSRTELRHFYESWDWLGQTDEAVDAPEPDVPHNDEWWGDV